MNWKIVEFDQVTSTQDIARQLARSGEEEGTVVLARHQTSGRGRQGRAWYSPRDAGIWATCLLKPDLGAEHLLLLPILISVSIASTVEEATGRKTSIKWPNDVYMGTRKLAGVLCEAETISERGTSFVLAGFGVNLITPQGGFPEEIADLATSVESETGERVDADRLLRSILTALAERYEKLLRGERESIVNEALSRDMLKGSFVKLRVGERIYEGRSEGIGRSGGLLLVDNEGKESEFVSGEVIEFNY
ncbi:MAG: biotin--[acetyl-CoA-carboxylase] ligase [Candidatus Glassbacteria bacterium]